MGSTIVNILFLIVAAFIGIGFGMFFIPDLLPFLDEQTRIIISIVLTFFTFISLYFMSKGKG